MKQTSFRFILAIVAMAALVAAAISVSQKNIESFGICLCVAAVAFSARVFGAREVDDEIQRQLDEVAARSPFRLRWQERREPLRGAKKVEEEQADEKRRRLIEEANASSSIRTISDVEEKLRRGERSAIEWLAHIRAVTDASRRSFRERVISSDELWTVVSDPDADTGSRAAAAVALRPELDEEGIKRLRVASEACESRKLRVAFERVADGSIEDGEIVAALSMLSRKGS